MYVCIYSPNNPITFTESNHFIQIEGEISAIVIIPTFIATFSVLRNFGH